MYREMYHRMFNAATDALNEMDRQNFGAARDVLISAQQACEEIYMESDEEEEKEG